MNNTQLYNNCFRHLRMNNKNILIVGSVNVNSLLLPNTYNKHSSLIQINSSCEIKYFKKDLIYDLIVFDINNYNIIDEAIIVLKINKIISLKEDSRLRKICAYYNKDVIVKSKNEIIDYINS